jgi:uncharacterized protein (DUF1684 family)
MKFRLFQKKYCRCLTFYGWLLLLLLLALLFRVWLGTVSGWLSLNEPVPAKTLVVEGWIEDYALKNAIDFYRKNHYKHLIVTGLPITQWSNYATFENTAEGAAAVMKGYGFYDTIYRAVIPRTVTINRTYNTALATRLLFKKHPEFGKTFNIYSVGVHARRSHLLFERAFGKQYRIGILSDTDKTFDPSHWWRTSKGFRNVSNEFVAYVYVWAFFHPEEKVYEQRLKEGYYADSMLALRQKTDEELKDSATSPLEKSDRPKFSHLEWFPVQPAYRIVAKMKVDTSGSVFEMATNTARRPHYRVYGYLTFRLHDTLCRLTAFQNMDALHDSVWKNYLFVPFRDKTNGHQSYAAGRYIDLRIPADTSRVILDFNTAYNPYCAYSHRWSCPLVPFENKLNVSVFAGEKKFRKP